MDTETRLICSAAQARDLMQQLEAAITKSRQNQEAAYARVVLEQMKDNGPWRLVIGVMPEEVV